MTDLTLYAFPTAPELFSLSPYCAKADILLKMAGSPFKTEMPEDYKSFSKGKLPVLKDGDNIIQDSEFIRYHLAGKYGHTLDVGLSDQDKAIGHAVCRMLDERTVLAMAWSRWGEDEGWAQVRAMLFEGQSDEDAETARLAVKEALEGAGFCKHTAQEMQTLLREDLSAIAALLGSQKFFLSDAPTYLDATVFSFIANLYGAPIQTWTTALVAAHQNLVDYFNRGMALWYPDAATTQQAAE